MDEKTLSDIFTLKERELIKRYDELKLEANELANIVSDTLRGTCLPKDLREALRRYDEFTGHIDRKEDN